MRPWMLQPQNRDLANHLADRLKLHPLVGCLLANRGVRTADEASHFLDRRLTSLHEPDLMTGVPEAADRICQAVRDGKKICIYGDYDVDGMCATALLLQVLRQAGALPRFYVPDRFEEGYGVNADALRRLRGEGVDLIVTVDCGICGVAEAQVAREIGLVLIITDHHEFDAELPAADVLVHPRLPGARYPFGELCGTGVAFKLAWELARRFSGQKKTTEAFRKLLLDATTLAAIGTVCDVVPMADENRSIVHNGLRSLKHSPPLGLECLMNVSGLATKDALTAEDIGFVLGPRLNACGRLGQARLGVELLSTTDRARAMELAKYLEDENKVRQTLERRIFTEAKAQALEQYGPPGETSASALVLAGDDWHPGVVGIVASRMVERYHRPCLMIALTADLGTGSGRSVPGFHLQQALAQCQEHLVTTGGHAMAAGLRVARQRLPAFRESFEALAADLLKPEHTVLPLHIDLEVPLHMLTPALIRYLEVLEPFGVGNPSPVMVATDLTVEGEPKKVGGGERHLSFRVRQNGKPVRAIAFGQAERAAELRPGEKCCVAFKPIINTFRDFASVELQVKDIRMGSTVFEERPVAQALAIHE